MVGHRHADRGQFGDVCDGIAHAVSFREIHAMRPARRGELIACAGACRSASIGHSGRVASTSGSDKADLTGYRLLHTALRGGIARLAAATGADAPGGSDVRRSKAIARYWKGYAGEIRVHHHTEDKFVFPALTERVPDMASKTDRTAHDHVEL